MRFVTIVLQGSSAASLPPFASLAPREVGLWQDRAQNAENAIQGSTLLREPSPATIVLQENTVRKLLQLAHTALRVKRPRPVRAVAAVAIQGRPHPGQRPMAQRSQMERRR